MNENIFISYKCKFYVRIHVNTHNIFCHLILSKYVTTTQKVFSWKMKRTFFVQNKKICIYYKNEFSARSYPCDIFF